MTSSLLRNYGLTIPAFNELSEYVSTKPALRQKVLLQAYYFRWALLA